jgi:flagellar hook-length control protein FliK
MPGSDFMGAAAAGTVVSSGEAASSASDSSDPSQPSFGTQLTAAMRASAKGQATAANQGDKATSTPVQPANATSSQQGKSGKKQRDSEGKSDGSNSDGTSPSALATAAAVAAHLPGAPQTAPVGALSGSLSGRAAPADIREIAESQSELAKPAGAPHQAAYQSKERVGPALLPTGSSKPVNAKTLQPTAPQRSRTETSNDSDSDGSPGRSDTAHTQAAQPDDNDQKSSVSAGSQASQSSHQATALPLASTSQTTGSANNRNDVHPSDSPETNGLAQVTRDKPAGQSDLSGDQEEQDLGTTSPSAVAVAPPKTAVSVADGASGFAAALAQATTGPAVSPPAVGAAPAKAQPPLPAEQVFAGDNHAKIVSTIGGQLVPGGGTMRIALDPPQLGALHITVQMHEGVMNASFETSNDQATRLLGHSLSDLKGALQAQGITVGKLEVRQSSTGTGSRQGDSRQSSTGQTSLQEEEQARQERQRKEALQRMWQRLSLGSDDLDLVA